MFNNRGKFGGAPLPAAGMGYVCPGVDQTMKLVGFERMDGGMRELYSTEADTAAFIKEAEKVFGSGKYNSEKGIKGGTRI